VDQGVDDELSNRTARVVIWLKLHAPFSVDGMDRSSSLDGIKEPLHTVCWRSRLRRTSGFPGGQGPGKVVVDGASHDDTPVVV